MTFLSEVERPLALFTQGITERIPIFHDSDTPRSINSSDLCEMFLPHEFSYFDDASFNRDTYRWLVLQQLGFRRYDTLSFSIETARFHIEYLAMQPMPTAHRTPDLELFYQHFPAPELASYLFYVIEETRVANLTVSEFPGAHRLRDRYRNYVVNTATIPERSPFAELVKLQLSLQTTDRLTSPYRDLIAPIFGKQPTVYSSAAATVNCYQALCATSESEVASTSEEELEEMVELPTLQRAARLEDWQEQLHEVDAQLLAMAFDDDLDAKQSTSDDALDGSPREAGVDLKQERDQLNRRIEMEKSYLSSYERQQLVGRPHFRYDEWDYLNQSWRKAWCSVYEICEDHVPQDSATELLKRIQPLIPAVRRRFEQVKPVGMRRVPRSLDGEDLDLNAIVEARADRHAGFTPTEHVYVRVEKKQRDVAACLLVDLSASTDDPVVRPDSNHMPEDEEDPFDDPYLHGAINFDPDQAETETPRKIIDVQKESVLLLATALENLGDLYCVYGFSGYGHDRVEVHVAKEFNESLNRRAINAIAAMKPLRSTRMGPAIRHATHKLLATGGALKVLLVISDGFPQDSDYGPDRSNHEYGIQDTAKAIHEAHEKGIQLFCITVDVSGHDYLRRMCQVDQYWVIEDTEELPNALQFAYRRLTS